MIYGQLFDDFSGLDGTHNLHEAASLKMLGEAFVRTKPGGLVLLSPTCGSWVWTNLGSSLRTVESWA